MSDILSVYQLIALKEVRHTHAVCCSFLGACDVGVGGGDSPQSWVDFLVLTTEGGFPDPCRKKTRKWGIIRNNFNINNLIKNS